MDKLGAKVLKHWDIMISWAEKQPKRKEVFQPEMINDTGHVWGASDCPWCERYGINGCVGCPMETQYNPYHKRQMACDKAGYYKVGNTDTWGEWVKAAKKFRKKIKKAIG